MPHDLTESDAVHATLNLLLPIRRQRLSRSERLLRQEEQTLVQMKEQYHVQQRQLTALKQECRQQRSAFIQEIQGRRQSLDDLKKQRADEQNLLSAIETQHQQCEENQQQQHHQRRQIDTARQTTRQCQKAVEKLEFLLTLPQEPS